MSSVSVNFLGFDLKKPIATGAGTFGYGDELKDLIDVSRLGAVVVKGTSFDPWPGNNGPRIWETPAGMLNAIGLQNAGLEVFIKDKLPKIRQLGTRVIVSIFDKSAQNYVKIAQALDQEPGIDALELNLSCPNLEAGGATFCATPDLMAEVIRKVKQITKLPLIAKLSPNVTDIVNVAQTAVSAGADGLTLINTLLGMAIDVKTRRPRLKNNVGGLSGPAIHPVAVACVWKVRKALPDVPIIGIGGVHDVETAIEMILAGANLVGIGTANFINPNVCIEIIDGLEKYCAENGVKNISELVGKVQEW